MTDQAYQELKILYDDLYLPPIMSELKAIAEIINQEVKKRKSTE